MKLITIWKYETTGTYTIAVDGFIQYECLAADEVAEVIKEMMEGETK